MVKPKNKNDRIYIWTKNEILSSINSKLFKSKVNFKNIYYVSHAIQSKKIEKNYDERTSYIQQIKLSVATLYSLDVGDFLISVIPKIPGGISCDDLVEMVSHAYLLDRDDVIKEVAQYVRRPFSKNCLMKIGNITYTLNRADAVNALINSSPIDK